MGKKEQPKIRLKDAIKGADATKKKFDAHVLQCEHFLSDPTDPSKPQRTQELCATTLDIKASITTAIHIVEGLKKADEKVPVPKDFEKQREDELRRLHMIEEQADALLVKLQPDETEEDYLSRAKQDIDRYSFGSDEDEATASTGGEEEVLTGEEEEEEEEDDNDSELEDDEEEYDDEKEADGNQSSLATTVNVQFEALFDYSTDQKDELSFLAGDVVTLVHTRDDGWWECEDKNGRRGLVPSTYMKEYDKYKDLYTEGDDSASRNDTSLSRSAAAWNHVKTALHEMSATDVLHAWGAVPSGFRGPTLARLHAEGDMFRIDNYLAAKLSSSNVFFKDLFYNPAAERIRPRASRLQKVVTLVACRQIPLPGDGTVVKSRWARVCLFNGTDVLSNIHTVRARCTDPDSQNWTFGIRVTDDMRTIEHGELFVRSVTAPKNIGILVELSVVFVRTKTNQHLELSCGWAHIPLLNEDGSSIANKQHDLFLKGGTPYEKGVEVDPTISRRATSKLKTLLSRNRQPVLSIRISNASKEQKEQLELLPEVLVNNICYLQQISLYRAVMADAVLRDKLDVTSTEPAFQPFLLHFPPAVEQTDLMDVLRSAWMERLQTSRQLNRPSLSSTAASADHDLDVMKSLLQQVFMEWVYPLMHIVDMPAYVNDDGTSEQARLTVINRSLQLIKSANKNVLASLLSPDVMYEPFDMSEVAYSTVGPHCTSPLGLLQL